MADISKEINDFKNAKYGKDVRNSMVSLAEKVNQEASDAAQTVSNYTAAETSRTQAEQDRQNAEALREQNFELMQSQSQDATNAANTAAERAEQAAEGDVSSKTVTFEMAAARAGVQSGDTLSVAFGKLAKFCADLQDHAFNPLVNNGLANVAGVSALDAVQANPDVEDTMANKIAKLYSDLTSLTTRISMNAVVRTITTGVSTKLIIEMVNGASGIIFGRDADNNIIHVIFTAGNYLNLGNVGTYTISDSSLTCEFGIYANVFIIYQNNYINNIRIE